MTPIVQIAYPETLPGGRLRYRGTITAGKETVHITLDVSDRLRDTISRGLASAMVWGNENIHFGGDETPDMSSTFSSLVQSVGALCRPACVYDMTPAEFGALPLTRETLPIYRAQGQPSQSIYVDADGWALNPGDLVYDIGATVLDNFSRLPPRLLRVPPGDPEQVAMFSGLKPMLSAQKVKPGVSALVDLLTELLTIYA